MTTSGKDEKRPSCITYSHGTLAIFPFNPLWDTYVLLYVCTYVRVCLWMVFRCSALSLINDDKCYVSNRDKAPVEFNFANSTNDFIEISADGKLLFTFLVFY